MMSAPDYGWHTYEYSSNTAGLQVYTSEYSEYTKSTEITCGSKSNSTRLHLGLQVPRPVYTRVQEPFTPRSGLPRRRGEKSSDRMILTSVSQKGCFYRQCY